MATFQLVRRQDLLAWSVQALRGQADVLEIEVRLPASCCARPAPSQKGTERGDCSECTRAKYGAEWG